MNTTLTEKWISQEIYNIEVNPVPIKTAMNLLGFNAGNLRMPLVDMDSANLEKLKKSMTDFGMKLA